MWIHNLNPVLISLGGLEIRYYGLAYVLGFFLAIGWMFYLKKKGELRLSNDDVWDFGFYMMLGVVVGSRLSMFVFRPDVYLVRPWEFFMFWHGGMSFFGGFVGIVVAGWIYCKKKKINFWRMADIFSFPAIFALALGRVANFINGELVGRVWDGSWCVVFPRYEECRHPSVLYGAGKRFLIAGGLLWLSWKRKVCCFKDGFIFWNFVFWEGLGRMLVDFYREDPIHFGLSVGQWLGLLMAVIGLVVFVRWYKEDWKSLFGIRKDFKEK